VRLLERDLGSALFERAPQGMVLTESGVALVALMARHDDQVQALRAQFSGSDGGDGEPLRVGVLEGLVRLVPPALVRLRQAAPRMRAAVRVGGSEQIEQWLDAGAVDLGFVSGRRRGGLGRTLATVHLPMYLVVDATHPLAGRRSVKLTELDGLRAVLPDASFGIRREVDRATAQRHVAMDVRYETNTLALAFEVARSMRLATLLTAAALPEGSNRGGMRLVPIADKRLSKVPVTLVVADAAAGTRRGVVGGRALTEILRDPLIDSWR
jgi:DNA-binding transcriptional LysR family regulator